MRPYRDTNERLPKTPRLRRRRREVGSGLVDGDSDELHRLVLGDSVGGALATEAGLLDLMTQGRERGRVSEGVVGEERVGEVRGMVERGTHSSKGDACLGDETGVDSDHAALEVLGDSEGSTKVLGVEVCRSTKEQSQGRESAM